MAQGGIAVALVGLAYLLGSVPFGYLLVRGLRGEDIRHRGSGNIGATNVQRFLGTAAGVATLALDAGKGGLAVWLARRGSVDRYWIAATAAAVVIGHSYPLFLRFRGGKGVATGWGAFLVLTPWAAAGAAAVFLVVTAISRFVSLGSMSAALSLPLFAMFLYGPAESAVAAAVGLLVVFRHRGNLRNLIRRHERRLGETGPEPGPESGDQAI